jgi:glutamine amidotransferase/cyclase
VSAGLRPNPAADQTEPTRLAKRVIACLDVRSNDAGDLVVTKGDQYDVREAGEVRNLGKPVDLARRYYREGADEITFLNITAFRDFPLRDQPMLEVLRRTSEHVFVPLTIGGGIRAFTDAEGHAYSALDVADEYFRSGADKISIGSDAVLHRRAGARRGGGRQQRHRADRRALRQPGGGHLHRPAPGLCAVPGRDRAPCRRDRIPGAERRALRAGSSAPSSGGREGRDVDAVSWRGPASSSAPARSCSTASIATAPAPASIWS